MKVFKNEKFRQIGAKPVRSPIEQLTDYLNETGGDLVYSNTLSNGVINAVIAVEEIAYVEPIEPAKTEPVTKKKTVKKKIKKKVSKK